MTCWSALLTGCCFFLNQSRKSANNFRDFDSITHDLRFSNKAVCGNSATFSHRSRPLPAPFLENPRTESHGSVGGGYGGLRIISSRSRWSSELVAAKPANIKCSLKWDENRSRRGASQDSPFLRPEAKSVLPAAVDRKSGSSSSSSSIRSSRGQGVIGGWVLGFGQSGIQEKARDFRAQYFKHASNAFPVRKTVTAEMQLCPLFERNCCLCFPKHTDKRTCGHADRRTHGPMAMPSCRPHLLWPQAINKRKEEGQRKSGEEWEATTPA